MYEQDRGETWGEKLIQASAKTEDSVGTSGEARFLAAVVVGIATELARAIAVGRSNVDAMRAVAVARTPLAAAGLNASNGFRADRRWEQLQVMAARVEALPRT